MARETQSLREKYGIYYLRYLEIRSDWHPTKNGKRKLSDFSPLSSYSAWWKCKENHVWRKRISNRMIRNQNCGYRYRGDEIITDQ